MAQGGISLTDLMGIRGYNFVDVKKDENNKHCFQFTNGIIIIECIAGGIFKLIYTNEDMLGYLSSGWLSNVFEDNDFYYYVDKFMETVETIRR